MTKNIILSREDYDLFSRFVKNHSLASNYIKKNFISIFSPLGAALMGYQKGDPVDWEVPAGMKTFQILEVENLRLPK